MDNVLQVVGLTKYYGKVVSPALNNLFLELSKGKIVEQGTHKDLLAKNGFYAEIYNSQFELLN